MVPLQNNKAAHHLWSAIDDMFLVLVCSSTNPLIYLYKGKYKGLRSKDIADEELLSMLW
jgi:hypothetical protein